jgi:protein-S-isoprenylcysteine O-methyltransferase Ste14
VTPFTGSRIALSRTFMVVVLAYVLASAPPRLGSAWVLEAAELAGFVLLALAAFGRVWCLLYIAGKKNRVLLDSGPFSLCRNPLYVFSFLGAVGFGLAVENPLVALLLALIFAVYYPYVVAREESDLAVRFGPAFEAYRARTPRWLPSLRRFHEPSSLDVDPVRFRKGLLDATWFLWAFFLWEILEELRAAGMIKPLF